MRGACGKCGSVTEAAVPWCPVCGALADSAPEATSAPAPPVAPSKAPAVAPAGDPTPHAAELARKAEAVFEADDEPALGDDDFEKEHDGNGHALERHDEIDGTETEDDESFPSDAILTTAPSSLPAQDPAGAFREGLVAGDVDELAFDLPEITDLDIVIEAARPAPEAPTQPEAPAAAVAPTATVAPAARAAAKSTAARKRAEPRPAPDPTDADLPALQLDLPSSRPRRASRQNLATRVQDFSVMFRIDDKARNRRRTLLRAALVIAIAAGAGYGWHHLQRSTPPPMASAAELLAGAAPPHATASDYLLMDRSVVPPRTSRVRVSALAGRLADAMAIRAMRGAR